MIEHLNGYVIVHSSTTLAVAMLGTTVVVSGTPDAVRAYCTDL